MDTLSQWESTSSILEFVSTIEVNATTDKFVAKNKFVINTRCNAPVKISFLDDKFKEWFMDGKTEDPISEQELLQELLYHKLRQSSVNGPIIDELGGEVKVETTLLEMWFLVEKQKHGEEGVLLNNDGANVFYIKDNAGVLRTVFVLWLGDGWYIGALFVGDTDKWHVGCRVFSRKNTRNLTFEPFDLRFASADRGLIFYIGLTHFTIPQ